MVNPFNSPAPSNIALRGGFYTKKRKSILKKNKTEKNKKYNI